MRTCATQLGKGLFRLPASVLTKALVSSLVIACAAMPMFAVAKSVSATPAELIQDMSNALKTLNYEGSFVHIQNDNVEAMSIAHSNHPDGELEYMLSLNGEAREVYRNHSLVTCIWPGTESVIISDSKSRKLLPAVDAALANTDIYTLSMGKPDRVAGIETHVVEVTPKDKHRYGYRFWIDKNTSMLLRSVLLDDADKIVEQFMFTNISYPETIPTERFDTPTDRIQAYKKQTAPKPILVEAKNRVDFEGLPAGYKEVSETYQPMPINDGPVTHVMLSDGMASVSVYVEYMDKASHDDMAMGVSSMGAMNAYMHSLDNALITVVGEVPSATVEVIAMSVRLVE